MTFLRMRTRGVVVAPNLVVAVVVVVAASSKVVVVAPVGLKVRATHEDMINIYNSPCNYTLNQ